MSNSSTSNPNPTALFVKSDVADLFSQHGVILVHCVSEIKGAGNTQLTPMGRLKNAIDQRCDVSASTIQRGDTSNLNQRRYYGPLGLILDPVTFSNISLTWPGDAGSMVDPDTGMRYVGHGREKNSPEDVSRAIKQRGIHGDLYNEICSSKWKIVGLFADADHPTFQRPTPLPPQEPDDSEWLAEGGVKGVGFESDRFTYDINIVGSRFPDLPLFFWQSATGTFEIRIFDEDSGIYKAKTGPDVDISRVYDCPDRY
jgi:hypothetical protein